MSTLREKLGFGTLALAASAVVLVVVSLIGLITVGGLPAMSWEFLSQPPREGMAEGGVFPAILGTFLVTLVTGLFAVPLGVSAAIFLSEYAKQGPAVRIIRLAIRNLAGVPSIVYGLFGVALFVHAMNLGLSIVASGLTLGLLTLPWTITASEEALRAVPRSYRDGAIALGATRWDAIRTAVLPAALPGVLTGAILGLARAAGETAPILFTGVTFSMPELPEGLGDPFMALPYHLYILSTQHHDIEGVRPLAYATSLVLLGLVLVFGGAAALLRTQLRKRLRR